MLGLKAKNRSESQLSAIGEESAGFGTLSQELFLKLLCLERKRTERSGRRFVLMLLDPGSLLSTAKERIIPNLLLAVSQSTRDTDIKGWYKDESILGAIFTEIGDAEDKSIVQSLSTKLTDSLYGTLSIREVNEIKLSFHIFPEDWDNGGSNNPVTSTLQMALASEINRK